MYKSKDFQNISKEVEKMESLKPYGIKLLLVFPVMWIMLSLIFSVSFWESTVIGIVVYVVAAYLGDLLILHKTNNITATISDLVLAFAVIWIGLYIAGFDSWGNGALPALITSIILMAGEWFFHLYLIKHDYVALNHGRREKKSYQQGV
jgi:hypothetical protein